MTTVAKDRIAEIRERVEKATPGPWNWEHRGVWTEHPDGLFGPILDQPGPKDAAKGTLGYVGDSYPRGINCPSENMEFIAHAREDVPFLLDRIAVLERECAEYALAAAFYGEHHRECSVQPMQPKTCTCGFTKVLERIAKYDADTGAAHAG